MDNKVETYSDMDIGDDYEPIDYGGLEIDETLDSSEENITSEDLYNQSAQQLEDTQYYGESEDKEQKINETSPPKYQGDSDSIIEDLYN